MSFTVVNVVLSLQTSGAIPSDNSAKSNVGFIGSALGQNIFTSGNGTYLVCGQLYQVTGLVTPSNYTGTITPKRRATYRSYNGTNSVNPVDNADDTSQPEYLDSDPQSGWSSGRVYDLDAPGPNIYPAYDVGTVIRLRVNFTESAVLGDSTFSRILPNANLNFYARGSCAQTAGTTPGSKVAIFDTSVSGDNQVGIGSTPLTANLQ